MVREIVFEIEVREITEEESRALIRELVENGCISGEEYDKTEEFEYIADYEGREYIFTHSTDDGCLTTGVQFWENGQRPRDRWMGGGTLEGVTDGLQHLAGLRDEIKNVTEKEVVAGPNEVY
jgi:hypothetical protein